MDFEKMKQLQPALDTIEREVIAKNEDAKESITFWADYWAELKPALSACVGAYCDVPELRESHLWDKAVAHLEKLATNMK